MTVGTVLASRLMIGSLSLAPSVDSCGTETHAATNGFIAGATCYPESSVVAEETAASEQPANLVAVFPPRANIGACGAALALNTAVCAPAPAPAAPAATPALTSGRVLQAFTEDIVVLRRVELVHAQLVHETLGET